LLSLSPSKSLSALHDFFLAFTRRRRSGPQREHTCASTRNETQMAARGTVWLAPTAQPQTDRFLAGRTELQGVFFALRGPFESLDHTLQC
jgi:hypothetical protein